MPSARQSDSDPPVLRQLVILHWFHAILNLVCGGVASVFYAAVFPTLFADLPSTPTQRAFNEAERAALNQQMMLTGITVGLLALLWVVANIAGANMIRQRKSYSICIGISALNLISFPIGTAIGLFSLITLSKPEIKSVFDD